MFHIWVRSCVLVSLCTLFTRFGNGQNLTGLPPFSAIDSSLYDNVKIADGGVLLTLPLRGKAGLIPFSSKLMLNDNVSLVTSPLGIYPSWTVTASGLAENHSDFGHGQGVNPRNEAVASKATPKTCADKTTTTQYTNWSFYDAQGTSHPISGVILDYKNCLPETHSGWTTDGSGYYATPTYGAAYSSLTYTDRFGLTINDPSPYTGVQSTITDNNGNTISRSYSSSSGTQTVTTIFTYADALSATPPLTVTTTATNTNPPQLTAATYVWTDQNNSPQQYAISVSTYTQKTVFACPLHMDIPATSTNMPSSLATPDGTYYFQYEPTPNNPGDVTGRLAKIVMPSGASIQYTYSGGNNNSGLACPANNSWVPILKRTLTDTSGKQSTWIYDTTKVSNATVVTDPAGNDSVHTFLGVTSAVRGQYESETQIYQGSYSSGTLLRTDIICYNGASPASACLTAFPPASIQQLDVYTQLAGMNQYLSQETKYDTYGNVTEIKDYDFDGALLRGSRTHLRQLLCGNL